jgi:hypothetical protein
MCVLKSVMPNRATQPSLGVHPARFIAECGHNLPSRPIVLLDKAPWPLHDLIGVVRLLSTILGPELLID